MALSLFGRRLYEQVRTDGADGGGEGTPPRKSAAEINAELNRQRLSRREEIARGVDGRRSSELQDVDGERVAGRFAGGEFDDTPEAREAAARREEDEAEQALEEQRQRDAEAERLEQEEARRLQAEGAPEEEDGGAPARGGRTAHPREPAEPAQEKVVDGVTHYLTIVNGDEKWLTLKQLREAAQASANVEETLQRAQDALQRATHPEPSPKPAPGEVDDKDLENIVLSAGMGDEEAVRKLVSVIKGLQSGATPQEVARLVSQQIATQREVDRAESEQQEILGNSTLEPVFRLRLAQFAQAKPKTRITEAYKQVGDAMRKDFAAMLKTETRQPSKVERKRTIVNPPQSAGRQQQRQDEDREVPVSETIDALARARGQDRAHRIRRS